MELVMCHRVIGCDRHSLSWKSTCSLKNVMPQDVAYFFTENIGTDNAWWRSSAALSICHLSNGCSLGLSIFPSIYQKIISLCTMLTDC
jgi:hypothetical protein